MILLAVGNKEVICDEEDYKLLSEYKLYINSDGYVLGKKDKESVIQISKLLMNTPVGMVIDHINHNRSDIRRGNLRVCTYSQNNMNTRPRENTKSGVTGVNWHHTGRWRVRITVEGKTIRLGYFKNLSEAIEVRKQAEIKYFGEFRYKEELQ